MIRLGDFFDAASYIRGQDDVAREHATQELTDETISLASMLIVAGGILVLWAVLGWVK